VAGYRTPLRRTSRRRFGLALGVSLAAHLLLAGDWPGSGRSWQATVTPQLQARIVIQPGTATAVLPTAEQGSFPAPAPAAPARFSDIAVVTSDRVAPENSGAGPGHHYYNAHELDRYPLPAVPLDLSAAKSALTTGLVRLWLRIDHIGRVVDLAVVHAEPPGVFDAAARQHLLQTRFAPASKDGRPVNSRILLELGAP